MRLMNGKMSKLSFTMYRLMRKKCELENDYNPKWLDMVSSCLANIGMNDVWIMQGNGFTTDYVNLAVKRKLNDIYLQQWYEDKQKNNFYNTIKDEWNLEYYLTKLNCCQKKILSKFRCRSNYLPVSQIKFYQNEDDWEDCLLCPFCRDDSVGDEFHYLFQCSFFNDERVKYIKEVYLQHPDEYTLISVSNSRNKGILSKLVEFIDLIMKIFEHRSSWDIEDIVQDKFMICFISVKGPRVTLC